MGVGGGGGGGVGGPEGGGGNSGGGGGGGGLSGDPNLDNMKSSPTTAPSTPQQQPDPHTSLEGFMANFIPGEHVRLYYVESRFNHRENGCSRPVRDYNVRGQSNVWRLPKY